MEVWKDIPGYEGLYQISSIGKVKSSKQLEKLGRKLHEIKRKDSE